MNKTSSFLSMDELIVREEESEKDKIECKKIA